MSFPDAVLELEMGSYFIGLIVISVAFFGVIGMMEMHRRKRFEREENEASQLGDYVSQAIWQLEFHKVERIVSNLYEATFRGPTDQIDIRFELTYTEVLVHWASLNGRVIPLKKGDLKTIAVFLAKRCEEDSENALRYALDQTKVGKS